jgi:hypothetical protein
MNERINELIRLLNNRLVQHFTDNFPGSTLKPTSISREDGKRYVKLVSISNGSRSVYAFIDLTNGDILKPASWKAPAKGARANVNADDFGMSCTGPYGVQYLRGPSYGWQ